MTQFSVKMASVDSRRTGVSSYHHHSVVMCVILDKSHQFIRVPIFPYDELESSVSFQVNIIYSSYSGCLFLWLIQRQKGFICKGS